LDAIALLSETSFAQSQTFSALEQHPLGGHWTEPFWAAHPQEVAGQQTHSNGHASVKLKVRIETSPFMVQTSYINNIGSRK
jgi:hypothetical protein